MGWFGVRTFYRFAARVGGHDAYEERVVLFEAVDADAAIAKAEIEAAGYVTLLEDGEALPCFQSFRMFDEPGEGAEVFSLIRTSDLAADAYIDRFFDTGTEFQREVD